MAWRGYRSYGKSALGIDFQVDGLDKLLEKIYTVGNSVDNAVKEAITEAAPITLKSMKEGAARHRKGVGKYGTDAVYDAIEAGHVEQSGNYIAIQVGIDVKKHPEAINGVFQEYGDGHSPEFPDPFVRPAFEERETRNEVKKVMRAVLKKRGVPIE